MNKKDKAIFVLIYSIISVFIITLYYNPVQSNEISIYHGTPFFYWILMLSIFLVLIHYIIIGKAIYAFPGILLSKIIFFSSPYIRGYLLPFGDVATHFGIIYDIINTGNFNNNWYPLTHISISNMAIILQAPLIQLVQYTTIFSSTLIVIFVYLISKRLFQFEVNYELVLIFLIIFTGSFYTALLPNGWAVLFFIIILYIFIINDNSIHIKILIFTFIFAIIITHPLGAVILFMTMVTYKIGFLFLKIKHKTKVNFSEPQTSVLILFSVAFLSYMMEFRVFNWFFLRFIRSFLSPSYNLGSRTISNIDSASGLGLTILDWSLVFIFHYYMVLFFIIILISNILVLIKKTDKFVNYIDIRYIIVLTICSIITLLWLTNLSGLLPALNFMGGWRLFNFVIPLIPIPFLVIVFMLKNRRRIIHLMLVVIVVLSFLTCFNNPIIYETSEFITYSEQIGYMTVTYDSNVDHYILFGGLYRYFDISFGMAESRSMDYNSKFMPRYFGYNETMDDEEWLDGKSYFIITKNSMDRYTKVFSGFDRYIETNWYQLNTDNSVNMVYSNGQLYKYYKP